MASIVGCIWLFFTPLYLAVEKCRSSRIVKYRCGGETFTMRVPSRPLYDRPSYTTRNNAGVVVDVTPIVRTVAGPYGDFHGRQVTPKSIGIHTPLQITDMYLNVKTVKPFSMSQIAIAPISWVPVDVYNRLTGTTSLVVRVYGYLESGESVRLDITDFQPWVIVDAGPVPTSGTTTSWRNARHAAIRKVLTRDLPPDAKRIRSAAYSEFDADPLYYATKSKRMVVRFRFKSAADRAQWCDNNLYPLSDRAVGCRVYDNRMEPDLQLQAEFDLGITEWMVSSAAVEVDVPASAKISRPDRVFRCSASSLRRAPEIRAVVVPKIMTFDIETYSDNPAVFPDPDNHAHNIFQIGVVISKGDARKGYLLTTDATDQNEVNRDAAVPATVVQYKSEADLINGFADLVRAENVDAIAGYNINGFDFRYIHKRAVALHASSLLLGQTSRDPDMSSRIVQKTLKTSARGVVETTYLRMPGRVVLDLLELVRADGLKLSSFSLSTVAKYYSNKTQDNKMDLTPAAMFKLYETRDPVKLGVVGRYCMQDVITTLAIFNVRKQWTSIAEMANTFCVPIESVYLEGQQVRIYAQVAMYAFPRKIIVENNYYKSPDSESYTGAMVLDPQVGYHEDVVTFDFSSLYPSIMIANNLDYSTMLEITNKNIPLSVTNSGYAMDDFQTIQWFDEPKDESGKVVKGASLIERKFLFLKSSVKQGVIPTLLRVLLDSRARVRREIKELQAAKDPSLAAYLDVLDFRQNSYKVACNSMYGAMGVKKGILPLMPAAMCTTAKGREAIATLQDEFSKRECFIVYGDTDSIMVKYPGKRDPDALYKTAIETAAQVSTLFPAPMKLEFECIAKKFLIMTKKRYVAVEYNGKQKTKGLVIARRDSTAVHRGVYGHIIGKYVFSDELTVQDAIETLHAMIRATVSHGALPYESPADACNTLPRFIITKSIKDISDYKKRALPSDPEKRAEALRKSGASSAAEYAVMGLPAHVQLAERMRARGTPVQAGQRVSYVIADVPGTRVYEKVEDATYVKALGGIVKVDMLDAVRKMVRTLDELFLIRWGVESVAEDAVFIHDSYAKVVKEIRSIFSPRIQIV